MDDHFIYILDLAFGGGHGDCCKDSKKQKGKGKKIVLYFCVYLANFSVMVYNKTVLSKGGK